MISAPFPWFGGKSRVAPYVWRAFGDVPNYVEPFFGSGAVLLGRPSAPGTETVNDKDGFVANFFRSVQSAPHETATWADQPVNENDLHARHIWLVGRRDDLTARLEGDPDYCDHKIAGWWVWGLCCWIGGGWCGGDGPWHAVDGRLVKGADGVGVNRKLPHLRGAGCGVTRQLPHLRGAGRGVTRKLPHLGNAGRGVTRKLPHLGNAGCGVNKPEDIAEWFAALSARLRRVRVACGDWSRVIGPSVTVHNGLTGVFLDPPYSAEAGRDEVYANDDFSVAHDVRRWCLENGDNPLLRIALCGYEGEHDSLVNAGWRVHAWKARGGYGSRGDGRGRSNAGRERVWFSPHCLTAHAHDLFSSVAAQ